MTCRPRRITLYSLATRGKLLTPESWESEQTSVFTRPPKWGNSSGYSLALAHRALAGRCG